MKTLQMIFAIFMLLLSACGVKTETAEAAKPAQETASAQLANPMREVTAEEMTAAVGIPLYAPEHAENVRYFTITTGDTVIGQMDFTLDGRAYTYRTTSAQLDETELSGMYFIAATESYAKVSYAEGKILTQGDTSVLYWEDVVPGVRYSLSSTECENPAVLLEIAEATFRPLQGDNG